MDKCYKIWMEVKVNDCIEDGKTTEDMKVHKDMES